MKLKLKWLDSTRNGICRWNFGLWIRSKGFHGNCLPLNFREKYRNREKEGKKKENKEAERKMERRNKTKRQRESDEAKEKYRVIFLP